LKAFARIVADVETTIALLKGVDDKVGDDPSVV
jgi:hypothetical protein